MKQRRQLIVTIEGNPKYFGRVEEMMRGYEVFGTGGGVKVVGVRRMKNMSEEIKIKEKVWGELEKEARTYKRDPAELAGAIIESNYILRLKGKEYED